MSSDEIYEAFSGSRHFCSRPLTVTLMLRYIKMTLLNYKVTLFQTNVRLLNKQIQFLWEHVSK